MAGKQVRSVGMVNQAREVREARIAGPGEPHDNPRARESVLPGFRVVRQAPQHGHGAPNWRAGDHSHGRAREAASWLARLAPEPERLPPACERTVNDEQSKWYRLRLTLTPLRAILEIEIWQGELWAHLTITGRHAPPTTAEVMFCRDLFLGDRKAIQIFPRKIELGDAGARSIHLYAPLESDALPSFSRACPPMFSED